ncbi:MAG: glucokinase [Arenicella sp.]|jgi:glucokinase
MFKLGISLLKKDKLQLGLIDSQGKCETFKELDLEKQLEPAETLIQAISNFNTEIESIGIVIPRGFEVKELVSELSEKLNLPVGVGYLGNASASYESKHGFGRGEDNFVTIDLHNKYLEAGIFVNGKLSVGNDGLAGDLGNMLVNAYGKHFPVSNYFSHAGIVDSTTRLLANAYTESPLRDISYSNLTAQEIVEQAIKGDALAINVFDELGKVLGLKLSDIVNYFSPKKYIISSDLPDFAQLIFKPAAKNMNKNLLAIFKSKISLHISKLNGEDANVVRASSLI